MQRLPRRGMSPRRFIGPPPVPCPQGDLLHEKREIGPSTCLWVPKTPGGGTRLEIGAFYHRLPFGFTYQPGTTITGWTTRSFGA